MTHRIYLSTTLLMAVRGRKKKTIAYVPHVTGTRIDKAPLSNHRVTATGSIINMHTEQATLSLR